MRTAIITEQEIESLKKVIEYSIEDEEGDYLCNEETGDVDEPTEHLEKWHIYYHLRVLQDLVNKVTK